MTKFIIMGDMPQGPVRLGPRLTDYSGSRACRTSADGTSLEIQPQPLNENLPDRGYGDEYDLHCPGGALIQQRALFLLPPAAP
jgi:hypothetical protein